MKMAVFAYELGRFCLDKRNWGVLNISTNAVAVRLVFFRYLVGIGKHLKIIV